MTDILESVGARVAGAGAHVARAAALGPLIEAEADEAERTEDVTPNVVEALKDANLFWMMVSERFGGGGVRIPEFIEVIEEVARADGSTGWVLMILALGNRNASLFLPAAEELYGGPEKAILGGFSFPIGTGRFADGGIIVSAPRVPFASGSTYATHLSLAVHMVDEGGEPLRTDDGAPVVRTAYLPKEGLRILGGWDVTGLVATGSRDYEVPEQFAPDRMLMPNMFWVDPDAPIIGEHLDRSASGGAGHAGVALGLMKRALQEVARITTGKRRQGYPTTVDEYPLFRGEFARHEAMYQSARRYVLDVYSEADEAARTRGEVSAELTARMRQATTYAHEVGQAVVGFADLWGSTQAYKQPSALGRCIRDFAVAKNHLYVAPISQVDAAPAILRSWRAV